LWIFLKKNRTKADRKPGGLEEDDFWENMK
jgi:hypothetical protein